MKLEFDSKPASLLDQQDDDVNEFVSNDGDSAVTHLLRDGIKAAQTGNRAEARIMLLRVTETDANNENAWLWLASISEYPEELLVFLKNVLNINPKNERAIEWAKATESLMAKTFVQRGIDATKNDQRNMAKQCFLQAIVHDSKSELAWLWLASVSNSPEEKVSNLQKVLSINPENENALSSLRNAKIQIAKALMPKANHAAISGKRDQALKYLDEILSDAPGFEDAWMLKGHLAESFEEKIAYFEEVLEVNPNNQVAKANLDSLKMFIADSAEDEVEKEEPVKMAPEVNEMPEPVPVVESREEAPEEVNEQPQELSDEDEDVSESFDEDAEIQMPEENIEYLGEHEIDTVEESSQSTEEFSSDSEEMDVVSEPETAEENFVSDELELDEVSLDYDLLDDEPAELELSDEVMEPAPEAEEVAEMDNASDTYQQEVEAAEEESAEMEAKEPAFEAVESVEDEPMSEPMMPEFENAGHEMSAPDSFDESNSTTMSCPFCKKENEQQVFACGSCKAILTLSDIEMLLSQENADTKILKDAVQRMETDKGLRGVDLKELKMMGIGYMNLKEFRKGFDCLQEAAKKDPNDIMLSSQIDALAIRIPEIEHQAKQKAAPSKSKMILVVDDSPTVRKLISGKLEKTGHEAVCAVDGMDALAKINEVVPDLILLDITMPRMDGYQVCKLIRGNEATKDVPVVMISGKDGFFDKVRGKMAGTSNYITKPFGPETLMKAVNEYIG